MSHALVRLGDVIDWQSFEQSLGSIYHPSHSAPGISTRLMVALHYLKYQHDLSDEDVVALSVENPYWQHFSGMRHFQHQMPIDPSGMTRWRKRVGDAGAEQMVRAAPCKSAHTLALGASRYELILEGLQTFHAPNIGSL